MRENPLDPTPNYVAKIKIFNLLKFWFQVRKNQKRPPTGIIPVGEFKFKAKGTDIIISFCDRWDELYVKGAGYQIVRELGGVILRVESKNSFKNRNNYRFSYTRGLFFREPLYAWAVQDTESGAFGIGKSKKSAESNLILEILS